MANLFADLPSAKSRLQDGLIALRSDGHQFDLEANLTTSRGDLEVTGSGGICLPKLCNAVIHAVGETLTLSDTHELRLTASPDIYLKIEDNMLKITGAARVDSARAIVGRDQGSVVRPSTDVRIDGEQHDHDGQLPMAYDVVIDLGSGVSIEGRGLQAELTGRLRVLEFPNQLARADGELLVSGSYRAYGQSLSIEAGRLTYSQSPLDDPGIDLTAVRQIDNVRVGVQVSGRLQQPRVELFSEPPLSDLETLSYLTIGRAPDAASDLESESLTQAALLAAVNQGAGQAQSLGSQLGFEEFGFGLSDELGGAVFNLGRRLSPRLYLSYSVGLIENADLIRLRYRLNSNFTLETEVGEETRATLRYRVGEER